MPVCKALPQLQEHLNSVQNFLVVFDLEEMKDHYSRQKIKDLEESSQEIKMFSRFLAPPICEILIQKSNVLNCFKLH